MKVEHDMPTRRASVADDRMVSLRIIKDSRLDLQGKRTTRTLLWKV